MINISFKSLVLIFGALLLADSVKAQEENSNDEWGDDWGSDAWVEPSPFQWRFNTSLGYGQLMDDEVNLNDSVFEELRGVAELNWKGEMSKLQLEVELISDNVVDDIELNTYQLNYTYSGIKDFDIKVGRQVITWGTGDLLFLNDLFSKSWKSFFNGRNDKYLKPPVDAVRLSHYGISFNWEVALLPEFQADETPDGERYSFFIPGIGIIQPETRFLANVPDKPEIAARVFGRQESVEWAIYAYDGYYKSPSKLDLLQGWTYAEMSSIGASIRMPWLGGLFNSEFAYYRSEDSSGNVPFTNNSQFRFLLGYETELFKNTTLGTQIYLERTLDYNALIEVSQPGEQIPKENRTMLTFRLTNMAMQQRLVNSLMLFYSPSDEDHYLRASSSYKYSDKLKVVFGLNFIEGETDNTFLAQMKENSNWFSRIEYQF